MLAALVLHALLGIVFSLPSNLPAKKPSACLPKDIKRTDIVSAPIGKPGHANAGRVTVEQKLKQIGARCRKGKLVDVDGKEVYFYRLQGCWGNPPPDYQEILERQRKELEALRQRYRVIEMTCNSSGSLISEARLRL